MTSRRALLVACLTPLVLVGFLASAALSAPTATELALTMSGRNVCAPTSLTAPAGEVRLTMSNPLDDWQSFGVEGIGVGSPDRVREGGSSTIAATLSPGTYTFWCGDDADDDDVMRGTLVVGGSDGSTGGGSAPPTPAPPPAAVNVAANDDYFAPSTIRVAAGSVTLTVTNSGRSRHTFTIPNVVNEILEPGQTRQVTFSIAAGTYTFFCGFHSGMRGTLVAEGSGGGTGPAPTTTGATTSPTPAPSGGGGLTVAATDFAFAPASVSESAGTISLTFRNAGQLPHTFTIDGLVSVDVAPGETKTVSFHAAPGTYRFYCAYGGHAEMGMSGTLTVTSGGGGTAAPPAGPPPAPTTTPTTSTTTGAHEHGQRTPPPRATALRCRRAPVTLAGGVVSVSRSALVLRVTGAPKALRTIVGKHVSVVRTARTRVIASGDALDRGLTADQRVRVRIAACRRGQPKATATTITVLPTPQPGTVLDLVADPAGMPKFDKTSLEAPAGPVTLRLTNPSPMPHSIAVDGKGYGKVVGKGAVSSVTVTLKPGRYTFFCTVSGHMSVGMKGTLVVR